MNKNSLNDETVFAFGVNIEGLPPHLNAVTGRQIKDYFKRKALDQLNNTGYSGIIYNAIEKFINELYE
jgi:hypothetical protein